MKTIGSFLKPRIKAARVVSSYTDKSFLYHFFDCLYCNWKYGCRCYQYSDMDFYKLRSFDRSKTLTSGHLKKATKYNDPQYLHYATRKNEFNELYSRFIMRDWLYGEDVTNEEVMAFIKKHGRVIVKPNASEAGEGIYILEDTNVSSEQIAKIEGKDVVVEECVVQHPDLSFGGNSVNTIRIVTMIDSKGIPHILTAALRCGVGDSVVDNFSTGGVGYPVNLEHGLIETFGVQITNRHRPIYIHPGTDIVMVGKKIPYWEEVIKMIKEAATVVPQLRYVGWDVAVTQQGPLIIEGNPSPGFGLLEGIGNNRGIYGAIKRYANA